MYEDFALSDIIVMSNTAAKCHRHYELVNNQTMEWNNKLFHIIYTKLRIMWRESILRNIVRKHCADLKISIK